MSQHSTQLLLPVWQHHVELLGMSADDVLWVLAIYAVRRTVRRSKPCWA